MFSLFAKQKCARSVEVVAKRFPQLSQRTDLHPAFSECKTNSRLLANTCEIKDSFSINYVIIIITEFSSTFLDDVKRY